MRRASPSNGRTIESKGNSDTDDDTRNRRVHPPIPHAIRHYGLLANSSRADNITQARKLLNVPAPQKQSSDTKAGRTDEPPTDWQPRPCYGGRMIIIERFERGACPALPPEPGGDQDRHLMIESAQSSSRNVGHFVAAARLNTPRLVEIPCARCK
jgi:hypothetical protein